MKSNLPRSAGTAERVRWGTKDPGAVAPKGSFVHPIPVNRTKRVLAEYPSRLMGKLMPAHSSLELLLLELLELLPFDKIWAQPERFKFLMGNTWFAYTPDCYAHGYVDLDVMIEVKPAEDAKSPEHLNRWKAAASAINEAGFELAVASNDLLLTPTASRNVTRLGRYRNARFIEEQLTELHNIVSRGQLTYGDLQASLSSHCRSWLIDAAIYHKHIFIDLWSPITSNSLILSTPTPRSEFMKRVRVIQ